MKDLSSEGVIPRRPNIFRALGADEPPQVVTIRQSKFAFERILKHDSWAASALYSSADGSRVVCKFARTNPILRVLPFSWAGRMMAERERAVFGIMSDTHGFPRWAGTISVDGKEIQTAVAHYWIDGTTFKPWLSVEDHFFPTLYSMVRTFHSRGMAYVDMPKWENILVGADGHPYLLDYQIRFRPIPGWPVQWLLKILQESDLYYLGRHWIRCRNGEISPELQAAQKSPPGVVKIGEFLGSIWRRIRLIGLRLFGVRGDPRRRDGAESPK